MSKTTTNAGSTPAGMPTAPGLNPYTAAYDLVQPYIAWAQSTAKDGGLESSLLELVKIRASQLNGCAICLDMHTKAARAAGETEQRLYLLSAWRESPLYSPRERAALAWTEALTHLDNHEALAATRLAAAEHFTEREQVALALMIVCINGFNRLGAGFGLSHPVDPTLQVQTA